MLLDSTPPLDVVDQYPLSPLQHGMLFHPSRAGRARVSTSSSSWACWREAIEPTAWIAAWQTVTDRHPVLRTRFRWDDVATPRQEVVAGGARAPSSLST